MSAQPKVVMPAIYRFRFDEATGLEGQWGWHRASELFEAINNIRWLHGFAPITTAEICALSPNVNLLSRHRHGVQHTGHNKWCLLVDRTGSLYRLSSHCVYEPGADWLGALVKDGYFLPAGKGIDLIDAIKSGLK